MRFVPLQLALLITAPCFNNFNASEKSISFINYEFDLSRLFVRPLHFGKPFFSKFEEMSSISKPIYIHFARFFKNVQIQISTFIPRKPSINLFHKLLFYFNSKSHTTKTGIKVCVLIVFKSIATYTNNLCAVWNK